MRQTQRRDGAGGDADRGGSKTARTKRWALEGASACLSMTVSVNGRSEPVQETDPCCREQWSPGW
ncbi:hypothetical protein ACFRKD_00725 [Streptomyces niveus]|uniref:hypothetical protein n=1 Tax=Streptomyces niveus TaxID=193462 RepID=UPI003681B693